MSYDYKQPNFYRFSEDSIILAKKASELKFLDENINCLDLGAGCGVVGIETALIRKDIRAIDFLEIQAEFIPFIEFNSKLIEQVETKILNHSFSELKLNTKYDLILGNLPYFDSNKSRIGDNHNSNLCRHFVIDDIKVVLSLIESNLSQKGQSLLLVHNHQIDKLNTNLNFKRIWNKKDVSIIHLSR